ncbi:unnamed protein product [Schistosoma curassoni]|uniref:RNA-binding protein n=1 Tax=Schistosoma curassoni TaxID=6186 RepID=A0A183KRV2_9TREM|nr:unnamed protein product [Schistosoma curassoni]
MITSEEDKQKEQKNVISILQFNNFPMKIIRSILQQDSLVRYNNNNSNEMPWIGTVVLPYRHGTTEEIQRILKHHRIKCTTSIDQIFDVQFNPNHLAKHTGDMITIDIKRINTAEIDNAKIILS